MLFPISKDADKPFTLITKNNNMAFEATFTQADQDVDLADVAKLFDLKLDPTAITSENKEIGGYAGATTRADGVDYVTVFKVNKVTVGKEWEFKAPTLSFVVNDAEGFVYTKFDAVIPAAVEVKKADLIKTT